MSKNTEWLKLQQEGLTQKQIENKLSVEPILRPLHRLTPISIEDAFNLSEEKIMPLSLEEIENHIDEKAEYIII